MDEAKPKKKKHNKLRNLLIDLATLFVIAVITIPLIVILCQSDGSSSTGGTTIKITALKCEKPGTDSPFLSGQYVPLSGLHKVVANFKNDNLTDAMYSYTATYGPSTDLPSAKTNMHIAFDLSYGNALVHRDGVWTESFSTTADTHELRMSVYSEAGNLRGSNAEVFMLPTGIDFPKTKEALLNAYEAAGFSCQVSE